MSQAVLGTKAGIEVADVWAEDERLPTVDELVSKIGCSPHDAAETIVGYATYFELESHETRGAEVRAAVEAAKQRAIDLRFSEVARGPGLRPTEYRETPGWTSAPHEPLNDR